MYTQKQKQSNKSQSFGTKVGFVLYSEKLFLKLQTQNFNVEYAECYYVLDGENEQYEKSFKIERDNLRDVYRTKQNL